MKTNQIHPVALFRLAVIGPLVSGERLNRGDVKRIVREVAQRTYDIPGSRRVHISEKTIQAWYHRYRLRGIEALVPKEREDAGSSKLSDEVQQAILAAKRERPSRSIRQLVLTLQAQGLVGADTVSRSAVHRLLQAHGISRPSGAATELQERRAFEAQRACDIWYGDVMHGPAVPHRGRMRKTYMVSLLDDASRLVTHAAFCLGETALDIEGVLKQAILRRGLPSLLVVDNGAAYRSQSLQGICARLGIRLVHCKPYSPTAKGKIERYHLSCRGQFLAELDASRIGSVEDLNARLWAWIETIYHRRPHGGLNGATPLERYQRDLPQIRTLGTLAAVLDELFHHRVRRHVRRDGTVSYQGARFEVPYELAGKNIQLVVDPHAARVIAVEDAHGKQCGLATPLDVLANRHRTRHKPSAPSQPASAAAPAPSTPNLIELAHRAHYRLGEQ